MTQPTIRPLYTHDCEHCVYLGPMRTESGVRDLYWCEVGATFDWSLISRWGDDGPDYGSWSSAILDHEFLAANLPEYAEAMARAEMLGLIEKTPEKPVQK